MSESDPLSNDPRADVGSARNGPSRSVLNRRMLVTNGAGIAAGTALGATAFSEKAPAQVVAGDAVRLSITEFGARANGLTNDGDAIRAAIAQASSRSHRETRIVFPAGVYAVDTIDLSNTRGITFEAQGTVQFLGLGGEFILGSRRESGLAAGSVYNFSVDGGQLLIAPAPGAAYRHALQLYGFVHSIFRSIAVSGEFGRSEYERAAIDIDRSWVNRFEALAVSCPGVPGSGRRSVAVRCGPDNVNVNVFSGCRISGPSGQPGAPGTVGIVVNGSANTVEACDISAVQTAIELEAARGCTLRDNYHEGARRIVVAERGNSRGCTILGGFHEIGADTVALSLGSSEATTVIGGFYRGTGGGTFVDFGQACYGLTVIEPMIEKVATLYRGRDQGAASGAAARLSTGGIVFPNQPARSDHPRTLDDYVEGRFVPRGNGFVFVNGRGSFTKIGDTVHLRFNVAFPPSGSRDEAAITGFPFAAADGEGAGVLLGDQRNPDGNAVAVRGDRLIVIDPRTGAARTYAQVAGQTYSGVATYAVAG